MSRGYFSKFTLGTALLTVLTASPVFAQSVFDDANRAQDRNDALLQAIEDDAERDVGAFGNEGRTQGFTGSLALRGIATAGNSTSTDIGIGANLGYVSGPNGYSLALNYTYGSDSGVKNEESLFYGLEYTRDINANFFGFAKLQGAADSFAAVKSDTFLGFGAGYRIFSEADRQWSVQAGPGYRFTDIAAVLATDISEMAVSLSSDYAQDLRNGMKLTNDTDILWANSDTVIYNDFAVSMSLTEALALRTSVLTEYHSSPQPGDATTDNTFGVSLVLSF